MKIPYVTPEAEMLCLQSEPVLTGESVKLPDPIWEPEEEL